MNVDELDRRIDLCHDIRAKLGYQSFWSLYDLVSCEEDFDLVVHNVDLLVKYDVDSYWGQPKSIFVPAPVTMKDMWRAAERLIDLSGDHHHVFIENFKSTGDVVYNGKTCNTIELCTGS